MCEVMDQINQCTVDWDVSDCSISLMYVHLYMYVPTCMHIYNVDTYIRMRLMQYILQECTQ